MSAEFIPTKVVSDVKPLFFLSGIASIISLKTFLSSKLFTFFSSPDEKLVTIDSYAIFAPFKKSALAFSSKLF